MYKTRFLELLEQPNNILVFVNLLIRSTIKKSDCLDF